jgi:hypothetical protein
MVEMADQDWLMVDGLRYDTASRVDGQPAAKAFIPRPAVS